MKIINGYGYSDNLDRLEYIVEIVIEMHQLFDISMEEAAGRFDRYAHEAMRFVKSDMFFHAEAEELAYWVYYGREEWEGKGRDATPEPYP